jgi:hypothetical protein
MVQQGRSLPIPYETLRAMPIYQVTPLSNNATAVGQVVREKLGADALELQSQTGWLVTFKGTTVELSHLLGVTNPTNEGAFPLGSVLVTSIGSYYGRGPTQMWEWLKTRAEAGS